MIERDYILRILQEFFDAIAKVVRRDADGLEPDTAQMQERFEEMYVQFFRRPARHFYEREKALIIDDLELEGRSEGDLQARVQMLAELLYHDGMIKRTIPERCLLLEKSLCLLEYLDRHSRTFSWERNQRMSDIKRLLTEF